MTEILFSVINVTLTNLGKCLGGDTNNHWTKKVRLQYRYLHLLILKMKHSGRFWPGYADIPGIWASRSARWVLEFLRFTTRGEYCSEEWVLVFGGQGCGWGAAKLGEEYSCQKDSGCFCLSTLNSSAGWPENLCCVSPGMKKSFTISLKHWHV